MRTLFFLGVIIAVSVALTSCNNPASAPNNSSSEQAFDSLAVADTITQHTTTFSTAIHQMTNDLNQIPITGNADRDFAIILKSYHQGTVDLAQAELKDGKDDALKKIAQRISRIQKSEITAFEHFVDSIKKGPLTVRYNKKDENSGFGKVIKTHKQMLWDMAKMDTTMAADQQFPAVMIQHLQSAVYLADGFLKYGKDAWLIQKAKELIHINNKQVEELKARVNTNKNAR